MTILRKLAALHGQILKRIVVSSTHVLTLLLLVYQLMAVDLPAADLRVFPFCNGECADSPDGALVSNIGTPFVHQGSTGCVVTKTKNSSLVHSGTAAFRVDVSTTQQGYAFFSIALHGFGAQANYWQSRDLGLLSEIEFWFDNRTGNAFILKLELKDYRDDSNHVLYKRVNVPAATGWRKYRVNILQMDQIGNPDIHRMRFVACVVEERAGQQVVGKLYFDDMNFREKGNPMNVATVSDAAMTNVLARRMTVALWGSRDREHGLVPLNSAYADVSAMNSTGGLIALLPAAVERNWLKKGDTDEYVDTVCDTLKTLMLSRRYLPPRYVDSRTLEPSSDEESSIDGAIIALSLIKYRVWLSNQNPNLTRKINSTLNKLNFGPFFDAGRGFRFAYLIADDAFTEGVYNSYSTEIYLLALVAQIAGQERVSIAESWNTGTLRKRLGGGAQWFLVAETPEYRSPFMQYLLDLFVKTSNRPKDSYPVARLRQNPWRNALNYQRFVVEKLGDLGLQPDAGLDHVSGDYASYSLWNGPKNLSMPWSAAFVHLANGPRGLAAFRDSIRSGHHSLFGLSESVRAGVPTARADLWNVSLCAMALTATGVGGNRVLSQDAHVARQLDKVFPQPKMAERVERLMFNPIETALEMTNDYWQPSREFFADALDELARQQLDN